MVNENDDSDTDSRINIRTMLFIITFVTFIMVFAVLLIFVKIQTRNNYNIYYNSKPVKTEQCLASQLYFVDKLNDRLSYQVKLNNGYVVITECRNNTWDITLDILSKEIKLCEYRNAPYLTNITNYTSLYHVRCKDHDDLIQKNELIFITITISVIVLLIIGIFILLFKISIGS